MALILLSTVVKRINGYFVNDNLELGNDDNFHIYLYCSFHLFKLKTANQFAVEG